MLSSIRMRYAPNPHLSTPLPGFPRAGADLEPEPDEGKFVRTRTPVQRCDLVHIERAVDVVALAVRLLNSFADVDPVQRVAVQQLVVHGVIQHRPQLRQPYERSRRRTG